MSLGELLVVLFIVIIVTKTEDIPVIIEKLQIILQNIISIKKEILHYFYQDEISKSLSQELDSYNSKNRHEKTDI